MSSESTHARAAHVERSAQDRIGYQLRMMYSELVRQPVPERLLSIIRTIEEAEKKQLADQKVRRAA